MIRAIKDLWYILVLWGLMRLNKQSAGELLEKWGRALQRDFNK